MSDLRSRFELQRRIEQRLSDTLGEVLQQLGYDSEARINALMAVTAREALALMSRDQARDKFLAHLTAEERL